MQIHERKAASGAPQYDVTFVERRLEDVAARLNRFQRVDEKPFEAVKLVSEFNQRAYELFLRPLVQAMSTEPAARLARAFHPLRWQRWAVSDAFNPWLAWLGPTADTVRTRRHAAVADGGPARGFERLTSETVSAALDYYRDMRDAMSEAAFFLTYGNLFSLHLADRAPGEPRASVADPRDLPFVKEALAALEEGGYAEALARIAALINRDAERIPLERLELRRDLIRDYGQFLPTIPRDHMRRIRGEQDIIVRYEPERALATLPRLLADPADGKRLLTLVERLLDDERVHARAFTADDRARIEVILGVLGKTSPPPVVRVLRSA
jgi:uncharacterized protein DUF3141